MADEPARTRCEIATRSCSRCSTARSRASSTRWARSCSASPSRSSVSEGRDYCGTICTREGDLVASGVTDLPAHLGHASRSPSRACSSGSACRPEEYFRPGRHRDHQRRLHRRHPQPRRAGDHARLLRRADRRVRPELAHWTDIGGHVPGTFDPNARSSHGEGLIIPPIHLVRGASSTASWST